MILNKRKNQIICATVLILLWCIYVMKEVTLFSEIADFVTPNTPWLIRLVEFSNYRGVELIKIFSAFFILVSAHHLFFLWLYNSYKEKVINQTEWLLILTTINLIIICVIAYFASIYWLIYFILAFLSFIVVMVLSYTISSFFSSKVRFNQEDMIYVSEDYETENAAIDGLNQKLMQLSQVEVKKVSGKVIEDKEGYYFEIYAIETLVLSKKGVFCSDTSKLA